MKPCLPHGSANLNFSSFDKGIIFSPASPIFLPDSGRASLHGNARSLLIRLFARHLADVVCEREGRKEDIEFIAINQRKEGDARARAPTLLVSLVPFCDTISMYE